jgi:tRNA threonylcarbamoyladenosine biosynthesis protein TsaB
VTKAARVILGIDTAGRFGSIALAEDGSASAWETLPPGEHSSRLSRAAERILGKRNRSWRDLTGIAVSSGPGSFTGLRIGLAWAKGVCFGSPAKLTLVSAHEANAYRHRDAGAWIAAVLQGERGEAQASLWRGGPEPALLWGPERVPEKDLAGTLREAAARFSAAELPSAARSPAAAGLPAAAGTPAIAIAGPDLKPELIASLEEAGFVLLDPEPPRSRIQEGPHPLPPTAAAVAELGDRNLLAGHEEDPALAAPAYGRAPNARRPSS